MTDEETKETKSSISGLMIIGIISSIIGGLIVYYLLRSKTTTTLSSNFPLSSQNTALIESRLDNIEYRLQQIQQLQSSQQQTQQTQQTLNNTSYKNNEIRKYIRDAKGRITSTEIIRNAKIS